MKVFITTSGTGSRLSELTQYTNKALVRIGKKPVLSYIIEMYPEDTEFVITLGYKGDLVRDFLELAYPDKKFTFIVVDKYEGPGTSLGYSMLQAQSALQSPFIFHACDTIVENFKAPSVDHNWVTGVKIPNSEHYTSFSIDENNRVMTFHDKGFKGDFVHIGLIGVNDYKKYWETLNSIYNENPNDSRLNDTITLNRMLKEKAVIKAVEVPVWLDMGNKDALAHARANISDHFDNLDKLDESLFFFDNFVIKFFYDAKKIKDRVERGTYLKELVPKTLDVRTNFYKYEYVEGELYSKVATGDDFRNLLLWAKKNLWKSVDEVSKEKFKEICNDFYKSKSLKRIEKFFATRNISDNEHVINDEKVPSIKEILNKVDFDMLSDGKQTQFHGDFILENIIETQNGYCLLDWRQDFGGLLKGGDIYYDLAKLAHNLFVNHEIISDNKFTVSIEEGNVSYSIERKENLIECEKILEEFLINEGLDKKKVEILRALIWLNMSPLHHQPFDLFLFYLGKHSLWKALANK